MIDRKTMSLDLIHITDDNIHSVSLVDVDLGPWIRWCPVS